MSDSPAPLSREIPATIHTEAVKALLAINGGACASMLAFLAAVWEKAPQLVPYIAVALIVFAVGLAFVGWINFVRAAAAVEWEGVFLHGYQPDRAAFLTKIFRFLSGVSLACFLAGVIVIACGAVRVLI
jgi:hypothetical protein